jgi:hypothetical protein
MAYSAEIRRQSPGCICIVIDQSGSMADTIAGGESQLSKAQFVADAVNRILESLVIRCAKGEEIRDYFDIAVIGYGSLVGSVLSGALQGRSIVSLSELANNPFRVEDRQKKISDGAGGIVETNVKFPVWVDPKADGGTPMRQALSVAKQTVEEWVTSHPNSFPPVVIHFTDGESTDGDPVEAARALQSVQTSDGATIILNGHVSSRGGAQIVFPDASAVLPDQFANALFAMSSVLPPKMIQEAQSLGFATSDGSRAFIYNARGEHVVAMLEIGTRAANLR